MSSVNSHAKVIGENVRLLIRSLDPTEWLLAQLKFVEALTQSIADIASKPTVVDKNAQLLQLIRDSPQEAVDRFVELLKSDGQAHVANAIRGVKDNAELLPISEEHWKALEDNADKLHRCVDSNALIGILFSDGVLSMRDLDAVYCKKTNEKIMVGELIAILQRKPDSDYEKFVTALRTKHQEQAALILTNNCGIRTLSANIVTAKASRLQS